MAVGAWPVTDNLPGIPFPVVGDDGPLYKTTPRRQESLARGIIPDYVRWVINNPGDPIGDQTLTVTNTVVGLTVPDLAISCLIQVQLQPIRWACATITPSATAGMRADANQTITLGGIPAMKQFQAFREGATDATLVIVYFD